MGDTETAVQHFFPLKIIAFSCLSLCQTIQVEMLSVCYEVYFFLGKILLEWKHL